jgi:hypothetical protein
MTLNDKALEKLRLLINEETEYRKGYQLVNFFNDLGSRDVYQEGFPSRWIYTDEKLKKLNGTPGMDKCITKLFNPINYVGRTNDLDGFIKDFNNFLAFDKWSVVRNNHEITFKRLDKVVIPEDQKKPELSEDAFLAKQFKEISIDKLELSEGLSSSIKARFDEIERCINSNSPLAVIFLAGSALEGVLLGIALKNPASFNKASAAPKEKDGKVRVLHAWTLSNLIDVANELGVLKEDVKKFSHALRDFRNYIHPLQQASIGFHPTKETADICWQVLRAALQQVTTNKIQ